MGYTHCWKRPNTISKHEMEQIVGDFMKCTIGMPEIEDTSIEATVDLLRMHSTCEALFFPRKSSFKSSSCTTDREPYDTHVCCFLLIAKKHLKTRIHVSTDGEQDDWQQAMDICSRMLGYEYKKFDITDNSKLRYRFWE